MEGTKELEYQDHEQQPLGQQAVPPSLLPSVLRHLGLGDAPTTRVEAHIAALRDVERHSGATTDRRAGETTETGSWEFIVTALHDLAWEVRAAAVWTLATWGEQAPVEALLSALSDEDGSVRAAALRTVSGMSDRVPLEVQLRLLHDAEWQVREAAALTVEELGEQAPLPLLSVSLNDENAFVREAARTALERTHPEALFGPFPALGESSHGPLVDHISRLSEQRQSYFTKETDHMEQTQLNANLDQVEQQRISSASIKTASVSHGAARENSLRKRQGTRATPHRSRLLNLFNGLAAVLVVGLIIVSALLLFVHRSPNVGSAPNTSIGIPFQPLPGGCFFIPQQNLKKYCPHDPFTQLNVSRDIAGYTVTLKQAYADANQVLIEYTATNEANHQPAIVDIGNYSTLRTQHGIALSDNGSSGFGPLSSMSFVFDPATIPTLSTRTLSLHLITRGLSSDSAGQLSFHPVTFDFSIPFHSGRATIGHKTVTVAGKSVTLVQMVATPSETRIYLQDNDGMLNKDSFSLTDRGKSVGELGASAVFHLVGPHPVLSEALDFFPLYESHAVCVLTVSAPAGSHTGPWIFHFTVS